jgi:hypothetical protein
LSRRDGTILRRGIPKRNTGPEGRFDLWARNAALKGPLFHGTIGGVARREETAGVRGRVCVPSCRMQ